MSVCAVVRLEDGLVINVIVADPTDLPPVDCQLIEVQPDQMCSIGWTWNGTEFIPPLGSA